MGSNYWDIRKRKVLHHLPAPDPVLERAGVADHDLRLRQSRLWMESYHAEKAKSEKLRHEKADEETRRGVSEHADASGEGGEAG
jgi:hypothetical protein